MSHLAEIRARATWRDVIEIQALHGVLLAGLLIVAAWALKDSPPQSHFLGLDSLGWAWASIWLAVLHQVIVAAGFRLQLHFAVLSRLFGRNDMTAWAVVFFPLLFARPITVLITAWLDAGSLGLPPWLGLSLAALLAIPAVWTFWSVHRFFGFSRAMGGDHFRDRFAEMPLVRGGIFRWSGNAMYAYGFLALWAIALGFGSYQALVVAAFQHAYIWVHFHTVEGPDMARIFPRA